MTRKITTQAANALFRNKTFKQSNTRVEGGALYLHGHKIAWIQNGRLYFCLCGYDTNTTCERLRGLDLCIYHKRGHLMHGPQEISARGVYCVYLDNYTPGASLAFIAG